MNRKFLMSLACPDLDESLGRIRRFRCGHGCMGGGAGGHHPGCPEAPEAPRCKGCDGALDDEDFCADCCKHEDIEDRECVACGADCTEKLMGAAEAMADAREDR